MTTYGDQALMMRPGDRGIESVEEAPRSSFTLAWASRAWASVGSAVVGPVIGFASAGNCHSFFGFHTNLRNRASEIIEKIDPPTSVSGQSATPVQLCIVAKKYWNAANEPPPTSSAGQTSNVCRHVQITFTM